MLSAAVLFFAFAARGWFEASVVVIPAVSMALLAAILGGGVFGDHCSPISDTTAVSAIASGCELLEHVRTQLPYALTAGAVTLLLYLAVGLLTL